MKYLIINADDFGFSPEINRGICEAHQQGVVTDASILICSPFAAQALAQGSDIGLPMGIHIDFVSPFVKEEGSCLGPKGRFVRELFKREYDKTIGRLFTAEELILFRDEIRRQVDLFQESTKRRPSHLDYHFGLHYLPDIMAIYLIVAEEYQISVRWGEQYAGKNPYFIAPAFFCDLFRGLESGCLESFLDLLDQPWRGVMEFATHPGYITPEDLPDEYNRQRELELRALTNPRLKDELTRREIKLVNFDWLNDQFRATAYKNLKKYAKGSFHPGVE